MAVVCFQSLSWDGSSVGEMVLIGEGCETTPMGQAKVRLIVPRRRPNVPPLAQVEQPTVGCVSISSMIR